MESGSAQLYRFHGPAKVRSKDGLAREFESLCLGVSDNETGGVARCVWTDGEGERIFIELSGEIIGPTGTVRAAVGAVVGGTGRYRGMEGGFELDWLFLESKLEPGKIMARTFKFEGNWKAP